MGVGLSSTDYSEQVAAGGYSLHLGPRAVTGECGAWEQTETLVLAIINEKSLYFLKFSGGFAP